MAHPAPGCREDADRHHWTHRRAGQELPRPALREVRLEIPRLEHSGDTRLEHSTPGWSYPVWNNPHQSALLSDLSKTATNRQESTPSWETRDQNFEGPHRLQDLGKASKVVNFDTDWSH